MKSSDGQKTSSRFRRGRKPHNANRGLEFANVAELIATIGAEPKRLGVDGQQVEMSWAERSFRLTVDRALKGNRRDLAHLLRLMIKHPSVSVSHRERYVTYMTQTLARC